MATVVAQYPSQPLPIRVASAMSYPSLNRSHRALPSLSSLSLPGSPPSDPTLESHRALGPNAARPRTASPRLHHPRPTHARPPSSPLLASTSSSSPPPPPPPAEAPAGPVPSAETYARVYAALRERLRGCEETAVRSAAERARGALEACRRSSVEENGGPTEKDDQQQPSAKRRRRDHVVGVDSDRVVVFDDNLPPALLQREEEDKKDGHGRSAPSSSIPTYGSGSEHVLPSDRPRKRSMSLPAPSSFTSTGGAAAAAGRIHRHHHGSGRTHTLPPCVPPLAAPQQQHPRADCQPLPFESISTSQSLPSLSHPARGPHARRTEALHNVVRSFETVLAVRAEGRRRSSLRDLLDHRGGVVHASGPAASGAPHHGW